MQNISPEAFSALLISGDLPKAMNTLLDASHFPPSLQANIKRKIMQQFQMALPQYEHKLEASQSKDKVPTKVDQAARAKKTSLTFDEFLQVEDEKEYASVKDLVFRADSPYSRMNDDDFLVLIKRHSHLSSQITVLTFNGHDQLTDKIIDVIGQRFSQLQSLTLPSFNGTGISPETLERLSKLYNKTLQSLDLSNLSLKGNDLYYATMYENLRHLSLNAEFLAVSPKMSTLTSLSFKNACNYGVERIIYFVRANPQLTTLSITHNPQIDENSLPQIVRAAPGLTSLDLSYCRNLSVTAIKALEGLTKLTAINLTDCFINDSHVSTLGISCRKLERVILARSKTPGPMETYIHDGGVVLFAGYVCRTLTYLDLANSKINEKTLESLKTMCKLLPRIENLHTCDEIPLGRRMIPELRGPEDAAAPAVALSAKPVHSEASLTAPLRGIARSAPKPRAKHANIRGSSSSLEQKKY